MSTATTLTGAQRHALDRLERKHKKLEIIGYDGAGNLRIRLYGGTWTGWQERYITKAGTVER